MSPVPAGSVTGTNVAVCSLDEKFLAVSSTGMPFKKQNQIGGSFATIVQPCRLFQLYYYLCCRKTYQTKIMPFLPLC